MFQEVITAVVLAATILMIISGKVSLLLVGLMIPSALAVAGVIPGASAFNGIGSKTTFLIVGALMLGDAFFRVGLTDQIGRKTLSFTAKFKNEGLKLFVLSMMAAILSSFLSSLGVQMAFLSFIIVMAAALGLSKTRALMALGYGATIGGTWTIIGTPLSVTGKSAYEALAAGDTIGMFEMSKVSVPVGVLLIVFFCLAGYRFVPDRCAAKEEGDILAGREGKEERGDIFADRELQGEKENSGNVIPASHKYIVIGSFLLFVILVALDGKTAIPAHVVTVIVGVILTAAGVSTPKQIFGSITWDAVFLIVGLTTLSDAVVSTGLGEHIVQALLSATGGLESPRLILFLICLVTMIVTQVMNNSGAFSIILPFLPTIALSLHLNPKPVFIATMITASFGFMLPLSAPSYPVLAREGHIQVRDWLLPGTVMALTGLLLTSFLVPLVWPLR